MPLVPTPIHIRRSKDESGKGIGLDILWPGNHQAILSGKQLRDACPCATCEEQRGKDTHANPLGAPKSGRSLLTVVKATSEEAYELRKIWAVGNYALGIVWGDGHDSGIYSYATLLDLSTNPCE